MRTVSLLTRKGEVAIAKRIERGQVLVLKTISRSPIVLKELLAIGEELRKGTCSIKEIIRFDHDELAEENIKSRTRRTLRIIDKIDKLHQVALKQAAKLVERTPRAKKRTICKPSINWLGRALPCRGWSVRSTSARAGKSGWLTGSAKLSSNCIRSNVRWAGWSTALTLAAVTPRLMLAGSYSPAATN